MRDLFFVYYFITSVVYGKYRLRGFKKVFISASLRMQTSRKTCAKKVDSNDYSFIVAIGLALTKPKYSFQNNFKLTTFRNYILIEMLQ